MSININGDPEELKRRVDDRRAFLRRTVKWLDTITRKHGKRTKHDVSSAWTTDTYVLDTFEVEHGFKFETYSGAMGSATLTVFHKGNEVLRVYWQGTFDLNECKVEAFNRDPAWASELDIFLASFDEILKRSDLTKERESDERHRACKEREADEKLLAEAKRLGVF